VESISGLFMSTLVRMHQNGQHSELLLNLSFTHLMTNVEDFVRIDKVGVEKAIKLILLSELIVLLFEFLHLSHKLFKLSLHLIVVVGFSLF